MGKFKIKFKPENKIAEVEKGEDLLHAAIQAGVFINSSCGGEGVCGRCKVIIKTGQFRTEPTGRITHDERDKGYVLACLTIPQSDMEIVVPPKSRLDLEKISEEESKLLRLKGVYSDAVEVEKGEPVVKKEIFKHSPLATKVFLKVPKPTLDDKASDLERLYRAIRKEGEVPIMQTGLSNIKKLGSLLRESDWKITATLGKRNETTEIVSIEPGDKSSQNYGVAFDIGTTTVTGQLVNLNTKEILGTKAAYNRQIVFGDDVITRIIYATEGGGLETLHHAVIDNMNAIIHELSDENKINLNDVNGIMCAGNTTMIHLLLRVDPRYIRQEPYVSTANFVPVIRAAEAGIKINPRGLLSCVPGVSTYVGGDITAGVLACALSDKKDLTLLIDIGTNGEIVLGSREWMASCAASAGPAFEGSGVSCGMRAAKGAVQKVKIDSALDVKVETIGGGKPKGICGSGYIDSIAELFLRGIITRDGRINKDIKSPRIRKNEFGLEFVLVFKKDSDAKSDIVITETDLENLKRSKGAVYSASSVLVKKVGLQFKDIKTIYIAGGFGTYLDIEKAVTIGLLPDVDRRRFEFIGNSSIVGCRQILLSYEAMQKAEEIARKMTYIELSVEGRYMDEYVASLFFPHTNLDRFPSVKVKK